MLAYCGHPQPFLNYWQPEQPVTVDPVLTLLSMTLGTVDRTQNVSPPITKRSMANVGRFTEYGRPTSPEWFCEDCPLQNGPGSVFDCALRVESEPAMAPLGQVIALCGILQEQQLSGLYDPVLASEDKHSISHAEGILTGTSGKYVTGRFGVSVQSVSLTRGAVLESCSKDSANSQRQLGHRASTSDGARANRLEENPFKEPDARHAIWELRRRRHQSRGLSQ